MIVSRFFIIFCRTGFISEFYLLNVIFAWFPNPVSHEIKILVKIAMWHIMSASMMLQIYLATRCFRIRILRKTIQNSNTVLYGNLDRKIEVILFWPDKERAFKAKIIYTVYFNDHFITKAGFMVYNLKEYNKIMSKIYCHWFFGKCLYPNFACCICKID